jgi:hypothetical protein
MAGWGFARTGELARGCGAVQKWHVCVRAQFPASHFRLTIFHIKTARRTGGASVLSAGDELMDWRTDELTSGRAARL